MAVSTIEKQNGAVYTITWTNATTTNVAPDTDTEIPVKFAETIVIQVDSTDSGSTATDIDCNVHTSPDGDNWDTVAYASNTALGDTAIKTFAVTTGPAWIRLRLDNNTGSSRADVVARVYVRPMK